MMVDWIAVLVRGVSFIALIQAAGGALFLLLFGRQLPRSAMAIRRFVINATVFAIVLLLIQFSLEATRLAGELAGLWDASLQTLAWHSAAGEAARLRLAGLILILVGLRMLPPDGAGVRRRFVFRLLSLAGIVVLIAGFTVVGHTVDHRPRAALVALLALHLLSITFWFGALWPLRVVVIREISAVAASVLERFSRMAVWIVPALLLAGATLVVLLVPGWSVFAQPYGALLLVKLAAYAGLMGIAALNKLRLTPALLLGDRTAAPRLRRALLVEYLLIAAVLIVTAVMTGLYSPG